MSDASDDQRRDPNIRPGSVLDFLNGTSLAPDRDCGECAVCCRLLDIDQPEISKPAGIWCVHCTGSGCAIHETRPPICRSWFCAWRQIEALTADMRPDKLGVMFHLNVPEDPQNILSKRYIRGFSTEGPENFDRPEVQAVIAIFRTRPIPVWLDYGDEMTCVHPDGNVQQVLLNDAEPASHAVAMEAERWRHMYEQI